MSSVPEPRAAIIGLSGLTITVEEVKLLQKFQPLGVILFARNVQDRHQLRALTTSIRNCLGREDAPILIDQEGGRVQRLKPPHWLAYPPLAELGKLYDLDNEQGILYSEYIGLKIALDLTEVGITGVCAPVLDLHHQGAHSVIGDRAFHSDPKIVTKLGEFMVSGFRVGGVIPILKHIPGHGRATADSHHDLPRIDTDLATLTKTDFYPFAHLPEKNRYWAMTAHIVYEAVDSTTPLTLSKKAIDSIIRKRIGFDGILISDDIGMKALQGSLTDLTRETLAAGCDIVLHCSGKIAESQEVLAAAAPLSEKAKLRLNQSQVMPDPLSLVDIEPESIEPYIRRLNDYQQGLKTAFNPQHKDPTAS